MEEKKFRNKVGWFQFLCCAMVIWSHAGNAELFLGKAGMNHWLSHLEYVHFPAVMGVSIPCFFMISGYLFFRFFTFDQLTGKWKRRVQTLLIPYLCWNLLYYVGYLAGSRIPAVADIVNRPDLQFSLKEMLEALFFYDYNPVFWFMYQLILLVALAPVIFLCMRSVRGGVGFLFLVMAGIFFHLSFPRLGAASSLNLDALFYYGLGAFGALHGRTCIEGAWTKRRCLIGVILVWAGIRAGVPYHTRAFIPGIVVEYSMAVAGLWLLVNEDWLPTEGPWMRQTFFVYALHFIPVRFLNKVAAMIFYGNQWMAAALYVLMPVAAMGICYVAAWILRRIAPKVWRWLSGGR